MATIATTWVVMKITQRPSKYGKDIFEITFANTNNEIAHTYIDEDNANFRRWEDIIKGFDQGFGILVNGLKIKKNAVHRRTGDPLVNADSLVNVVHVEDEMQTVLEEFSDLLFR